MHSIQSFRDASLTPTGINQASELKTDIMKLNPSLLVISPLTRNLQTADVACHELLQRSTTTSATEVIVTPLLREHTYSTCDIGTSPAQLAHLPHWAANGINSLSADWWAHDPNHISDCDKSIYREPWQNLQRRTSALVDMLTEQSKKHKCIVVVGHAVLFYALTGNWMANCQLTEFDLNKVRPHCECAGLACRCDMDFYCQTHT